MDAHVALTALPLCVAGLLAACVAGLARLRDVPAARMGAFLALFPALSFAAMLGSLPNLLAHGPVVLRWDWIPALGLSFSLYYDALAALFALLITGIGALVLLYGGYYFAEEQGSWRFQAAILAFLLAMLGVVVAGDLVSMFVFWEGTSVTSFLLIGYRTHDTAAQRGALKAMLITGAGGLALLTAAVLIGKVTGSVELAAILSSGDTLRTSDLYPAIFALVVLAAFTKSAQTPFHIWLPESMSAPTPASAFLHSATMVKAGVYLLLRLNPVLGATALWFWTLVLGGMATMLVGAWLGLRQRDLKALLAYSTISQLGVLVMLIGHETPVAYKAAIVGILAHALYKSALFLVVGIVDHAVGTRDLHRLGGLRQAMPATFSVAAIAALSMAGLPPMFGFLAKETLLAAKETALLEHGALFVPQWAAAALTAATVAAAALMVAQAAVLVLETFVLPTRDRHVAEHAHDPPLLMLLGPAAPTLLSVFLALIALASIEPFVAAAAEASYGDAVKVSLHLWTGLHLPVVLSAVVTVTGAAIFLQRDAVRAFQTRLDPGPLCERFYAASVNALDFAAALAVRVQNGQLRRYLSVVVVATGVLLVWVGFPGLPEAGGDRTSRPWLVGVRGFSIVLSVAAAAATVALRRDIYAILAIGTSGLAIALHFLVYPAPDVALVMIVVDTLTMVILVLALARMPDQQRRSADALDYQETSRTYACDAGIAAGSAVAVGAMCFAATASRPRPTYITPFVAANAKPATGAADMVGAIIVDFRALDTFIEITVFALAGLGVFMLLRYATRAAGDPEPEPAAIAAGPRALGILGRSSFARALAHIVLPLSMLLGATHMMYGHDQPGDGFTAAVIVSLGLAFRYVVSGYREVRETLRWLHSLPLIGAGLALALIAGTIGLLANATFLSPVDLGAGIGLPLPRGFGLTTSFLTEVAIFLAVLGGASVVIDTLRVAADRDEYEEDKENV